MTTEKALYDMARQMEKVVCRLLLVVLALLTINTAAIWMLYDCVDLMRKQKEVMHKQDILIDRQEQLITLLKADKK